MRSDVLTVQSYLAQVPVNQAPYFSKLRDTINAHLPKGYEEVMNYGMIGYVVPHALYPAGYHVDSRLPVPFMALAAQKHSINFYHMGLYVDNQLTERFHHERYQHTDKKLDMGKSCMRFKNYDAIPYTLIGRLVEKISVKKWLKIYETMLKKE